VVNLLVCNTTLYVPELAPLQVHDCYRFVSKVVQGITQQVVGFQPNQQRIEQLLNDANCRDWATYMFEPNESSAWLQNAHQLMNRLRVIRNRAQAKRNYHGIKRLVNEAQRLRVTDLQDDVTSKLLRSGCGFREHDWTQVDANEMNTGRVCVEIPTRANANFECVSARLRARPLATVFE
jgi:hypothetical protein